MLWAFLAAPATAGEPRPGPEVERTSATLGKALLPATPESAAPARLLTDATASFFRSEETGRLGLAAPADTRLTLATRLFRQSQTRTGRLDPLAFADTVGVTDRRAGRVTMGLASADGRFSIESGLGLTGGEALSREDQLVHRLGLVPPEIGETPGSGGTAHWHSGRLRLVEREGLRLVSRFAHKSIEAGTDTAALAADLPFTDGTRSELGATLATGGVEFEALQRTDRFEARQTALSRLRAARKGMAVAFARGEEHRETPAGAFLTARDTLDLTLPARRLAAEPLGLGTLVPATLTLSGPREESAGAGTGAIAQTGQGVGLEAVWPYEGGRTRLAIRHR
ncbi:MAG: hypothetical protein HXY25_03505, partial [Alphaproteobacteria bacterium]|nr:hypothetical protein [Alphaproteobacteria bacterium]